MKIRLRLSLSTHYGFLSDQYLLVCEEAAELSDRHRAAAISEYRMQVWLEMVEVWDRMSFRQKCAALKGRWS